MRKSTKRIITLVLAIATLTGMLNAFSASVSASAASPNLGNGSFLKIHEWAITEGRNSGDFGSAVTYQYWLDSVGSSTKDEGPLADSGYFTASNGSMTVSSGSETAQLIGADLYGSKTVTGQ